METTVNHEDFDRLAALHQERFKKSFYEALDDVHTLHVKMSHLYRPGEKATVMHVHVRDRIKQNFEGVPGVKIEDKPGRAFKVHLDGAPYDIDAKAEFKCKKFRPSLLTSSIITEAVKRFQKGLPQRRPHIQTALGDWREPEITGGIEPGHGNAGYVIDAMWLAFERLCLIYHTGLHSVRLAAEIPLDGAASPVVEMPLADITEVTPRKRVKPRKQKEAKPKTEEKPKKHIKLVSADGNSTEEKKKKRARNNGEDS